MNELSPFAKLICSSMMLLSTFFVSKSYAAASVPLEDIEHFTNAISQIKHYYVEPVNDKKLFENAIRGMLAGLDPHSSYLDEEEYKNLRVSTRGEFAGLGIEVGLSDGVIKVISPIDNTPAHKAGVKAGDLIVRLDDTPVRGMSLSEAVKQMRGKKGTPIKLTIFRKNETKPLIISVVRDLIRIESVNSKMVEPGIGYIRLSHFQEPTAKDLRKAAAALNQNDNLKGLVLDLRNNPGGLLEAAIEVSDSFLNSPSLKKNDLIVYTKGRVEGSKVSAQATPGDVINGKPIVVLINGGSASASEIVAGALQDHKRAIIMGTRTFGKGSVQTVLPLSDTRGIKLTTALYYTPKGNSIQARGITPDIIVSNMKLRPNQSHETAEIDDLIKEADLTGHLANGNGLADAKHQHKKAKDKLNEDFQIMQAVHVIKAVNVLKQKQVL